MEAKFSRKRFSNRLRIVAEMFFNGRTGQLAKHLGMSAQTFSKYLGGDRTLGGEKLSQLANLGVSVEWVLSGSGDAINPDTIGHDAQWKRLNVLRNRTRAFHGTPRIAAETLGVELDTYKQWEMGLEPIPADIVDKVYELVSDYLRKDWWYEGKGEMFIENPLKDYEPPDTIREPSEGEEFGAAIPLDPSQLEPPAMRDGKWTQKDVEDFKDLLSSFKQNTDLPREVMFEVIKLFIEDRSDNSEEGD